MEKKITTEELENLKKLTGEFNTIKSQLGDLTLQEHALCMKVEDVKKEFAVLEGALTKEYGKDSVINLENFSVKYATLHTYNIHTTYT